MANWVENFDYASLYPRTFSNNKAHFIKISRKIKLQKILKNIINEKSSLQNR
jgi:hypothetical protein